MFNYFRYLVVLILLGGAFYSVTLVIEEKQLKTMINKKLPMIIKKKGVALRIEQIEIVNIVNNIVESKVHAKVKIWNKEIALDIQSKAKPKVEGAKLSFELVSLKVNKILNFKKVKGVLKEKLESIKMPLKKLENISWFVSVKGISFKENKDLDVEVRFSRLIIFLLIPLFLLREIGLFLIFIYQRLLSHRKKYRCAKGELYQKGTCSSSTKEAFEKHGFIAGMKEYRASTKACKKAYTLLKRKNKDKSDGTDCNECGVIGGCEVFSIKSSTCDIGVCDIGSC